MGKLPWMKFFPSNYLADTRGLSPSAKGIWMDLICFLWESDPRGQITDSVQGFMRMCGSTKEEIEGAFGEFMSRRVCQIQRDGHGRVTVISRRISREEKERENARIRKQRERQKENVTDESRDFPPEKIEDRSQKIEDRKELKASVNYQGENQSPSILPTIEEKKELSALCVQVNSKCGNRFNAFAWIQKNIGLNPKTHIHVLKRMNETREIKNPWGLADQIASIEDGNYNEKDHIAESEKHKIEPGQVGNIFKNLLKDG